jgi:toxin ParE1/3/4
MTLRINPFVYDDLVQIKTFIAEDNPEMAQVVIEKLYAQFDNILLFPNVGSNLSSKVNFKTDLKSIILDDYAILYKISGDFIEIYRIINVAQDLIIVFREKD